MAISTGEGYSLLGQGFAQAAQGNISEQRKMMKEAQRRQLMTAALTPIAQGVGQFATDLISAPFKDAASNFYNRGAGKGLNANRKAYRSLEKQAKDRMAEINKQGKYTYFKPLSDEAYLAYDAKSQADLGEGFKSHAAYSEGLVGLPSLIRKQQDKEYDEALVEYNSYLDSPTQAQVSAAIKKYSPYATNPASWLYKKAKQLVLRQDPAEVEQKSLNRLQTHLSSYGMDLSAESLAKLREVNRTGSDAYFSLDAMNNMPQFKTAEYQEAVESYRKGVDVKRNIFSGENGALQDVWFELNKQNDGILPTGPQVNRAVDNKMAEVFQTDLKQEQANFRSTVNSSAEISKVLKDNIAAQNLKGDALIKYLNTIADGAFVTAKRIHQNDLLKTNKIVNFGKGVDVEYGRSITRIAEHLILNNVKLDVIEDNFYGTDRMLTVIDADTLRGLQSSTSSNTSSVNSTVSNVPNSTNPTGIAAAKASSTAKTSAPQTFQVDLATPTQKSNVTLVSQLRQGLRNILGSDLLLEDKQAEWKVMQTKMNSNLINARGGDPAASTVMYMYPPDVQQMITDLEEPVMTPSEISTRNREVVVKSLDALLSNLPFGTAGSEIQARKRAELGLPPETAFTQFRTNRAEAIQRQGEEKLAEGKQFPGGFLSGERVVDLDKRRGFFANDSVDVTEADKEPDVEAGTSILDSVIDFLIPKAEASTKLKEETKSTGTSVSRIAKRNKTQEMNRWEDKDTITVSNVYNDGRSIEVPTKNPVRFIQDNIDTPTEAVAIYYEALKVHNAERPSSPTYQMKPLTQAMTWAYEAFPDQLPNLERMYSSRIKNKESGRSLLKLIESPSNEKEIKAYTDKVSKMTDAEKEKEFNKQLTIARKIKIETDSDLAANAVAYRKLQNIFGEDNRVIGKEGTTVSDKVDQYYTYLLPTKDDNYDLITKVYEQVLANVKTPVPFSLLAQR